MANDLNQCNFIGRLGRDPEARTFPSGDQVVNASLAVGSKWRDKNSGENKESTEWVRLTFHGKLAEIAAQYLRKGSQIFVSGQQRTREWEKDGITRYATEIRVENMQMLGQRQDGGGSDDGYGQQERQTAPAPAPRQAPRPAPTPMPSTPRAPGGFDDMDDDIPYIDPMRRSLRLYSVI